MTSKPTDTEPQEKTEDAPEEFSFDPIVFANDPIPAMEAKEKSPLKRKRHKRHKRRRRRIKRLLIALGIILVLVAAGLIVWNMGLSKAQKTVEEKQEEVVIETPEEAVTYDEGRTVTYDGHTYTLNENLVSVCFVGYDKFKEAEEGQAAGQSDVIAVATVDTETGEFDVIVIPRESMVDVDQFIGAAFQGEQTMQLCLSFSYGDGGATSAEYTRKTAQRILYNMPITYYFAMDMSGIATLNDAIGGVALTPLATIPGTNIVQDEDTVLFGDNALLYVRYRDTTQLTSSLDRQERQMQYIKAYAKQALSQSLQAGGVSTLVKLFNSVTSCTTTDMDVTDFQYMAQKILNAGVSDVEMHTLEGEIEQGDVYAEFYLDEDNVYETVLDVFYNQTD